MKYLPCHVCSDGVAKLPNGDPYWIGSPPSDIGRQVFRYSCYAHMSSNPKAVGAASVPTVSLLITALQFNQLPEHSDQEAS